MSTTINVLNDLITIAKDGEQGFKNAAEETKDEHLKSTFMKYSKERTKIITILQYCVENFGETPTDSGSILGTLHRGWLEVKSTVMGRNSYAILSECERGEDAAKATFSKALEADLPANIHELIREQYELVKQAHDNIRDLRDQYAKEE